MALLIEQEPAMMADGRVEDVVGRIAEFACLVEQCLNPGEIELEGGRKLRLGPGHILLAEDTTGQGHISRASGSQDRLSLFITLADGAKPPR